MAIMETDLLGKVASVSILPLHTGVAGNTSDFLHFGQNGKSFGFAIGLAAFSHNRWFRVFRLAILMATHENLDILIIVLKVRLSSPAAR
jgi:hypothetical protein